LCAAAAVLMKDHYEYACEPIQLLSAARARIVVQFERDMRIKSCAAAADAALCVVCSPEGFLLIA
jgi:hypothetical protein